MIKTQKRRLGVYVMAFFMTLTLIVSAISPLAVNAETASDDSAYEVEDPENYVSELTGERVIDGVGEQTGVRYQPVGYTWDPEVESEVIDDIEYWTYDINGLEDNNLGMQMMINCDPIKANGLEEGVVYESEEEIQEAINEVVEKVENIVPEETEEENGSFSVLGAIFPKADAATVTTTTPGALGVEYQGYDLGSDTLTDGSALTYRKKITFSSSGIVGNDGTSTNVSWAYCIAPNRNAPEHTNAFSEAKVYENLDGWLEVCAKIIYYGYGNPVFTAHGTGWSYADTDAALYQAAKKAGIADSGAYNGSTAQSTALDNYFNNNSAPRNLYNACVSGDWADDGYSYALVELISTSGAWQNVLAVSRRTQDTPNPVELTVKKVDKADDQWLAGAKYQITWNGKNKTTDFTDTKDGSTWIKLDITNDDIGKEVTVKEIQAPEGYELDSTPQTFKIEAGLKKTLTFKNAIQKPEIKIKKVDADTGEALKGAKFKIEWNGNYTDATTGDDGTATINLPITRNDVGKDMKVTEVGAPAGYYLSTETYTEKIVAGKTYTYTFTDRVMPVKVTVKKVDEEIECPLPGAVFQVDYNNKTIKSEATDKNGCATIEIPITGAEKGMTATVKEITPPNGFNLSEEIKTFTLTGGAKVDFTHEVFTNKHKKGTIGVYKTGDVFDHFEKVSDNEYKAVYTTQNLKNCVFEVYAKNDILKADGSIRTKAGTLMQTITTDADGYAETKLLNLGTYTVKEVSAPAGYVIADPIDVTIGDDDVTKVQIDVKSDVHNKWQSGSMTFTKTDGNVSEEKRPKLEGAVFKIFQDVNGKAVEIGNLTTDKNGTIKMTDFPVGRYYYQEVQAPNGYLCNDTQTQFDIYMGENSKTLSLNSEIENMPAMGTIELLKTAEDREKYTVKGSAGSYKTTFETIPLEGCEFNLIAAEDIYSGGVLRAKKGDIIAHYTTDSEGKGVVDSYSFRKEGSKLDKSAQDLTALLNRLQTARTDEAYIGKYQLVETAVPKYYQIIDKPISVEITYDGEKQVAHFVNPEKIFNSLITEEFDFTKTSITTGKPVPGVTVNIYNANKKLIVTSETDAKGEFTIDRLPIGKYYYQECNAPIGFVIDESLYPFEVTGKDTVVKATMADESQQAEITLQKNGQDYGDYYVDEEGKTYYKDTVVEGAGFAVVAAQDIKLSDNANSVVAYAGDIVAHGVTDKDGKITFTDYSFRKGTTAEAGTDLTTLEEGTIQTENAVIGSNADATLLYKLVEDVTPDRYRDLESDVEVTIGAGTEHEAVIVCGVEAFNYARQGDFVFTKTDIVTSEPLPNTTITIYDEDRNEIFTGVTNEKGQIEIEGLPEGTYYYQEHEAPYGYIIDEGYYEFTITDNEVTMAELADKLAMGDPILEKTGEDYTNYTVNDDGTVKFEDCEVAGAKFAIVATEDIKQYDSASTYRAAAGDIIGYVVTDENGIGKTNEYYFRDGKTLTGDEVVEDTENVDEEADNEDAVDEETDVTDDNNVTKDDETIAPQADEVAVEGADAETGDKEAVEDVETEAGAGDVEGEEGEEESEPIVLPAGTDLTQQTEGVEVFEHVFLGSYKFVEVEAPENYLLSEDEYPFTVEYVDQYTEFIEVRVQGFNKTPTGNVIIDKVDVATGEPIPGATITIYDENKNVIFEKKSDENGQVQIQRLPVGHYYYQETNAPNGYELNEDLFEFEIKENGEIVKCQITNKKIVDTGVTGTNTFPFILGGIAVIVIAGTTFIIVAKKRKNA